MRAEKCAGFICFGEVNTPYERLKIKHDYALAVLGGLDVRLEDAGIVIDDSEYRTADEAAARLHAADMDCLIVCVAGWIPSHAVIRVTDEFRTVPMILWGLCGWTEDGHIVTTADQAGTTALRPAFEEMGYRFRYLYSVMGEEEPVEAIRDYICAAWAAKRLRKARIGSMGYRDMLLYGTQYEGNSLRSQIGIEVEPFEMLEMMQNLETVSEEKVLEWIRYIKKNWSISGAYEDGVLEKGVRYALAIGRKIEERGYEAITLTDVDGMKKLLGFPPAMIFMLLNHFYGVQVIPENDVMGAVTQLMLSYLTGTTVPYLEYYEFFKDSLLAGVPDFVPESAADGEIRMMSTSFGMLNGSLLNVSKVKTGYVTCIRLAYKKGSYKLHCYTGEAKEPPEWEECGWKPPAPRLPSVRIYPDRRSVDDIAQTICGQHVLVGYGDYTGALKNLCDLLEIELI